MVCHKNDDFCSVDDAKKFSEIMSRVICDLTIVVPDLNEKTPDDFVLVNRSVANFHTADLNKHSGGPAIHLALRSRAKSPIHNANITKPLSKERLRPSTQSDAFMILTNKSPSHINSANEEIYSIK